MDSMRFETTPGNRVSWTFKTIVRAIATCLILLSVLSCKSSAPNVEASKNLASDILADKVTVKLRIVDEDHVRVTVSNGTSEAVLFCPREDFLTCYHRSPDGIVVPITYDCANADMALVGPLMLVCLMPQSTYTMVIPLQDDRQPGVDNRGYLNQNGVIYAEVRPVNAMDKDLIRLAKDANLIKETLVSNKISR